MSPADHPFGPFSVASASVSRLGPDFTAFVNELLRAEAADAGLAGGSLVTTDLENVPDGGVDAFLESAAETSRLPRGKSAWQFKSGDLQPAECAKELRGAVHALEILRDGGSYRLVLGADLNARKVAGRRKALQDEAGAHGIAVSCGTFAVFNASDLAAWAAEHPSLAVSPLLGGITHAAVNFAGWSGSAGLAETWVANRSAAAVAAAIDELVAGTDVVALHVQGVSGLGKTRSVMEAVRGKPWEALVAYVHAADALPPGLAYQFERQKRHAILVVDECDGRMHELIAQQIPAGSRVRLITIGTPSGYRPKARIHKIGPVAEQSLREVVRLNVPSLPPGAARVTVAAADGNVKLALLLADDLARRPAPAAEGMITREIIESYVTRSLPSGRNLLASAALALFASIGFESDAAGELQTVASGLGLSTLDLKAAAEDLHRDGLLSRLGRFRAVAPHPLAIYLARRGWEQFAGQITASLLPSLDRSMTARILQRATDIGESAPVREAVIRMLAPGGAFEEAGTADDDHDDILPYLAVLAPQVIAGRLAATLAALDDQQRKDTAFRRPEITLALEKLAWHRETFQTAADGLLSLAVTDENSSAAAGPRRWADLFGAMLPITSAPPQDRIRYLAGIAASTDVRALRLAVTAAARACAGHETVGVFPEVQGGFLVAARGTPGTLQEAWDYVGSAMDILADLAGDRDPDIADEAAGALAALIHPYLENRQLRDRLAQAISQLPPAGLTKARTQIEHLRALFARAPGTHDTAGREADLDDLEAAIPAASDEEEFDALAGTSRWDFRPDSELQRRLDNAALTIPADRRIERILETIATRPAAGFELGRTLSTLAAGDARVLDGLIAQAAARNTEPLTGYLTDRAGKGEPAAFDDLLDSSRSAALDDASRLSVSTRGPQTDRGWQRVERLVQSLPPRQGTRGLIGWHTSLDPQRLGRFLSGWMSRLGSQADYNLVVDFTGLALSQQPPWQPDTDPLAARLVEARTRYPDLANQEWDWTQLARRQLDRQPAVLHETLLVLIETGSFRPSDGTEEETLLRDTIEKTGPDGWRKTMERIATSPRMQAAFHSWLASAADAGVAEEWAGTDLARARLLARVADPGGDEPDPVARFLLAGFGTDSEVSGALGMTYITGTSVGNYSARCQAQISQLAGWADDPAEAPGVRIWAQTMITWLSAERDRALRNEAEYDG
jgi:hypothetical protein